MPPLELVRPRTVTVGVDALDAARAEQLDRVLRLRRGMPLDAPIDTAFALEAEEGSAFQLWEVEDGGAVRFQVWIVESCEMVVFAVGTPGVVNYTIQSGLELHEPAFASRELVHDCVGEGCWACGFAAPKAGALSP